MATNHRVKAEDMRRVLLQYHRAYEAQKFARKNSNFETEKKLRKFYDAEILLRATAEQLASEQ